MKTWMAWVTWVARIVVGVVFIVSGFVKAVDPWGTFYKIQDYVAAMGHQYPDALMLAGSFGLCALEFLLGIFILFGCFRVATPLITTLFMAVMVTLTYWIATKNPVPDCGCFGDAIILSNTATFWKNVVLMALSLWLLFFQRKSHWLITPALQWIVLCGSIIFIFAIELVGYNYQPLIDFRPYKVGEPLIERSGENDDDDDANMVFVYEKDGKQQEFNIDDVPDEEDGWTFVDRREAGNDSAKAKSLRIFARESDPNNSSEDVTEELVDTVGRQMIVFIPDMAKINFSPGFKINSLYQWDKKHDINMFAVVSGSEEDIDNWQEMTQSKYPIYIADDTQIKEVARGNPAVVYLDNGKIVWKRTLSSMPYTDFNDTEKAPEKPEEFIRPDKQTLTAWSACYVSFLAFMLLFSHTQYFWIRFVNLFRKKKKKLDEANTLINQVAAANDDTTDSAAEVNQEASSEDHIEVNEGDEAKNEETTDSDGNSALGDRKDNHEVSSDGN